MPLCPDCKKLSPCTLLARPTHQPNEDDGIDPSVFTLKSSFSALEESSRTCQLCALFLRDLDLNYDLPSLRSSAKDGLPTPIQIAANSSAGLPDDGDSMNDVARVSTIWVVCGSIPSRDDETIDRAPRPSLKVASTRGMCPNY